LQIIQIDWYKLIEGFGVTSMISMIPIKLLRNDFQIRFSATFRRKSICEHGTDKNSDRVYQQE